MNISIILYSLEMLGLLTCYNSEKKKERLLFKILSNDSDILIFWYSDQKYQLTWIFKIIIDIPFD